ncbi:hypothetical protein ACH5RR_008913 [Cinchona calisaya]|uniref:Uncharacterized protein n=1 Tax=Cinchona calisaya TaxID=153742 RepID=A0ABD3ACN9_9GENT
MREAINHNIYVLIPFMQFMLLWGTMARLIHTARKNIGHRYSYMNHFHNMRLGRGSKIDPITLMLKSDSKATEYSSNDESWSDDEIYPKDDSV